MNIKVLRSTLLAYAKLRHEAGDKAGSLAMKRLADALTPVEGEKLEAICRRIKLLAP